MTRLERAQLCAVILIGLTHGFLHLCWDTAVDRDRTLDRWPPRR